jgi:hypothetical protein
MNKYALEISKVGKSGDKARRFYIPACNFDSFS